MHLDRIEAIRLLKLREASTDPVDPIVGIESIRKIPSQNYITLPSFLKVKIGEEKRSCSPPGGTRRNGRNSSSVSTNNSSSNINIHHLDRKHSSISSITSTTSNCSSHTHTATTSHTNSNSSSAFTLPTLPALSKILTPQLSRLNSITSPEKIENGKPGKGKREESGSVSPKRGKSKRRSTRHNTMGARDALEENSARIKNIEDAVQEHSLKDLAECSSMPSRDSDMSGSMNGSMTDDAFYGGDMTRDVPRAAAMRLKMMERGIEEGVEKEEKKGQKYFHNRTSSADSSDNLSFNGSWKEEKEDKMVRMDKGKKEKVKKEGEEGEGLLTPPQSPFDHIIRREYSCRFDTSGKGIDIASSSNSTRIKNDNTNDMNEKSYNNSTKINYSYTNKETSSSKNNSKNSLLNREMSLSVDHALPHTIAKERFSAKIIIEEHSSSKRIRDVDFPVLPSPRLSTVSTPRLTPTILSPRISPISTPTLGLNIGTTNNSSNKMTIDNNVSYGLRNVDNGNSSTNSNSNSSIKNSHSTHSTKSDKSNISNISIPLPKLQFHLPLDSLSPLNMHSPP